jgi:hypothetical protein
VALIGAGNLGHALFAYPRVPEARASTSSTSSTPIRARSGQMWEAVRIAPLSSWPQRAAKPGIDIAIIAVPVHAAQGSRRCDGAGRDPRHPELRAWQGDDPGRRRGARRGSCPSRWNR